MPSTARSLPVTLLRTTLLVIAAVLTTGTAATVIVAGDSARRSPREAASSRLDLAPFRRRAAMRALLDSLVAPLGAQHSLDSAALRRVVSLTRSADRAGHTNAAADAWIAPSASGASPADSAQQELRVWARSAQLPSLWGYAPALGGIRSPWELPVRSWPALQRFVLQNEADADSALLRGDAATAMLRARETISAARHFLDQPLVIDGMFGRYVVQHGARLLARSARQGDEPAVASQALRLVAMARDGAAVSQPMLLRMRGLGLDLADGRLLAIARDTTLSPALRLATVRAGLTGVCLRTGELLVGVAAERRAGLQALAAAVADVPRAEDLVPLELRALDAFDESGLRDDPAMPRVRDAGRASTQSTWLVPALVRQRAAACRAM